MTLHINLLSPSNRIVARQPGMNEPSKHLQSYTHHLHDSSFYSLCFIQLLELSDTTSTNANILTINTLNIHFAIA